MDLSCEPSRKAALVLASGIALGAYEAGACTALLERQDPKVDWVAGVSIGAVNAALIAGGPPAEAPVRLKSFWRELEENWPLSLQNWFGRPFPGAFRQMQNEISAFETLMFGQPGLFQPRILPGARAGAADVPALFDLAPLRRTLTRWIDADWLNAGQIRLTVCCTDIVAGERVVFDTGRGDRIGVEQIVASCALLPVFGPIECGGRLLGDGALSGNVPLDAVLYDQDDTDRFCFVVELFGGAGQRPRTLAASASRAADLGFAHQTQRMLDGWERESCLRSNVARLGAHLPPSLRAHPEVAAILAELRPRRTKLQIVEYHGGLDEAGVLKGFDFSKATLEDRWQAGANAMQDAWSRANVSTEASP